MCLYDETESNNETRQPSHIVSLALIRCFEMELGPKRPIRRSARLPAAAPLSEAVITSNLQSTHNLMTHLTTPLSFEIRLKAPEYSLSILSIQSDPSNLHNRDIPSCLPLSISRGGSEIAVSQIGALPSPPPARILVARVLRHLGRVRLRAKLL